MLGGKGLPQPPARGPAIEVEIEKDATGARRLTIRVGVSALALLMVLAARALGFDAQWLLRLAVHFMR